MNDLRINGGLKKRIGFLHLPLHLVQVGDFGLEADAKRMTRLVGKTQLLRVVDVEYDRHGPPPFLVVSALYPGTKKPVLAEEGTGVVDRGVIVP